MPKVHSSNSHFSRECHTRVVWVAGKARKVHLCECDSYADAKLHKQYTWHQNNHQAQCQGRRSQHQSYIRAKFLAIHPNIDGDGRQRHVQKLKI